MMRKSTCRFWLHITDFNCDASTGLLLALSHAFLKEQTVDIAKELRLDLSEERTL